MMERSFAEDAVEGGPDVGGKLPVKKVPAAAEDREMSQQ